MFSVIMLIVLLVMCYLGIGILVTAFIIALDCGVVNGVDAADDTAALILWPLALLITAFVSLGKLAGFLGNAWR